jgi:hypothetical protein
MALTCSILKTCNYLQVAQRVLVFGSIRKASRNYHSLQKRASATGTNSVASPTLDEKSWKIIGSSPSMYKSYKREMSQQTSDSDFIFRQVSGMIEQSGVVMHEPLRVCLR